MGDLVFLTGVSGFLGGHVALELLKQGYRVRGSLRDLSKADHVRDVMAGHGADVSGLEFCKLDLLDDEGWQDAAKGARYLQHVASPLVIQQPKDKMELIRPAVEGTERAINAALNSDIERIVLTSSAAAIMYGHPKTRTEPFTDADWTNLSDPNLTPYVESKALAEQRAWELMDAAHRHNDLVTVNPVAIFGPLLDRDPGTSAIIIQRMMNGSTPAGANFAFGYVDVRDVAALQIKAMQTNDAGGQRYPISASTEWMMPIVKGLAQRFPDHAGKAPKFAAPDWAVRLFALFDRDIRDNIDELGTYKVVNADKAIALLGRELISVDDAAAATMQSLIDQNLL